MFENETTQGSIPLWEFIKPVDEGIKEALTRGVLAGYPGGRRPDRALTGSYHDADPPERAFKIAGPMALQDAAKKAKPVLLEPVMCVEVAVSKEHMGDAMGNLPSRRGQIQPQEDRGGMQIINARVTLVRDVRLRDGPPFAYSGARDLLDALSTGKSRRRIT